LAEKLATIDWTAEAIHGAINEIVTNLQLKFPKIAMPLRVMLCGIAQSPSIDQVMVILGQKETLNRIQNYFK
jgi:glutamyl-tRNA synthetase